MEFVVEQMRDEDWPEVADIYREGISTGDATFETDVSDWEKWDRNHLSGCRLVAKSQERIVGWFALSSVSGRFVYSGVAEISIYVRASARRQGIGKALLEAAIKESERIGIWTLQSGTFPENIPSINLQKSCGFREVGTREKIGCMYGRWRDVVLMERRSEIVGE